MNKSYNQFCPIALTSEVLCCRWTLLIIRGLLLGANRFNQIKQTVPLISPSLLSNRLKELYAYGIITIEEDDHGQSHYSLSAAGLELKPIVMAFGNWGKRWFSADLNIAKADPSFVVAVIERHLILDFFKHKKYTLQFHCPEEKVKKPNLWITINNNVSDFCLIDPGFEIDLLITSNVTSLASVHLGDASMDQELRAGNIKLQGNTNLKNSINRWFGLSKFAQVERHLDSLPYPH